MSGEEKGDAKQEQTADDRRHDGAAIMPLSQAARIARLKAAEEKSRAAQQALGDRDRGRDRLDPTPADLAEVMAHAPQEPRADRVRDAADRPDRQSPGAVGHQRGPGPDRSGHDRDPVVGADQRLEHPPGAQEEVAGDHVIAAVTAAFAPPQNPEAEAARVDDPPHRAATAVQPGPPTSPGVPGAPERQAARHPSTTASAPPPNPKAEAAVERLKQKLDQAQAKRTRDSLDSESAQSDDGTLVALVALLKK